MRFGHKFCTGGSYWHMFNASELHFVRSFQGQSTWPYLACPNTHPKYRIWRIWLYLAVVWHILERAKYGQVGCPWKILQNLTKCLIGLIKEYCVSTLSQLTFIRFRMNGFQKRRWVFCTKMCSANQHSTDLQLYIKPLSLKSMALFMPKIFVQIFMTRCAGLAWWWVQTWRRCW